MVNSAISDGEHVVLGVAEGSSGAVERRGGGGGRRIGALELDRPSRREVERVVADEDSVVGVQSLGGTRAAIDKVVVIRGEGISDGDEREEGEGVERDNFGVLRHWSELRLEFAVFF